MKRLDKLGVVALVGFLRSPVVGVPDALWIPLWAAGLPAAASAMRQGDYKLIEDTEHDRYELFRLASDSGEQEDLYVVNPAERLGPAAERILSLKALLDAWPASHPLAEGRAVELSRQERRRLRALGYLEE